MGRLHTCYSPVRRSPPKYCYSVLPLDLHVLSLSLAFILSQDQTLPCISFVFVLSLQGRLFFLDGSIFTQNLLFLYYLYLTIPKSDCLRFKSVLSSKKNRDFNRLGLNKAKGLQIYGKFLKQQTF